MTDLRENLIVGLGNPLLDISAIVNHDFLEKYDLQPNNAILAEDKHKKLYEELLQNSISEFTAGGSVQNTLRVAQWLLKKPNVATFFGCVGKDKYSEILENKARLDGVNVQYQYDDNIPTGTCAVLITGHHRSLCANLSAANNFTIDHILKSENIKLINSAEFYYISGFFLTVSPKSILEIASVALDNNRPFMMNLSAKFISEYHSKELMDVIPFVDILFGNEEEAESFAKFKNWSCDCLVDIGKKIIKLPKHNSNRSRIVVITQGHDPVLLIQEKSVNKFNVTHVPTDKIVDTNGAGDAFVGGFLSQYIQGKSLDICINCGIWTAGKIIQNSGCTFENILPDFNE